MAGGRKRARKKELPKRSRGRSKFEKALQRQIEGRSRGGQDGDDKSSSSSGGVPGEASSSSSVSVKRSRRGETSVSDDTSDLAMSLMSQMSVGGAGSAEPTPSTSAQPHIPAGGVGTRPAPSRVALRPLQDLPSSGPSRPGPSGGTSVVDERLQVDSMDSSSPNQDFHDDDDLISASVSNDSLDGNVLPGNNGDSPARRDSSPSSPSDPSSPSISPVSDAESGSADNSGQGSHDEVDFGEEEFDEERIAEMMREFRCQPLWRDSNVFAAPLAWPKREFMFGPSQHMLVLAQKLEFGPSQVYVEFMLLSGSAVS